MLVLREVSVDVQDCVKVRGGAPCNNVPITLSLAPSDGIVALFMISPRRRRCLCPLANAAKALVNVVPPTVFCFRTEPAFCSIERSLACGTMRNPDLEGNRASKLCQLGVGQSNLVLCRAPRPHPSQPATMVLVFFLSGSCPVTRGCLAYSICPHSSRKFALCWYCAFEFAGMCSADEAVS